MKLAALDAPIGAEVVNFDPAAQLTADHVQMLLEGLTRHSLLLFRGQELTKAEFVNVGRAFGELEILPEPDKRDPEHPEIFNLSNVRPDGELVVYDEPQSVFLRGTQRWHTDSSFREIPCLCTLLYAVEVPPSGGETQFADMFKAWESLPVDQQRDLEGSKLVHDYVYSRANNPGEMDAMSEEEKLKYPAVTHPLARTHPDGRRSLYMGGHVSHIDGQPVEEGRAQVAQLTEQVTTDDIVYEHQWQARDLVVWDNRSTLHRLRPYDIANQRRVMRRLTVVGTERVV